MIINKRIACKLFIVFVTVYLLFLNMAIAQENSPVPIEKSDIQNNTETLPHSVLNTINNNCRNCKLVTLNDLVDETREEFLELHQKITRFFLV